MGYALETIKLKCDKCGKEYEIKSKTYYSRQYAHAPNYCKDCMREHLIERKKSYYASLSEEQKEARLQKVRLKLASRTKEEWDIINKKNSDGLRRHWKTVSQEDKEKRVKPMHKASQAAYAAMTPEERSERSRRIFDNLPPERREKIIAELSERMKAYNKSLPREVKMERAKAMQRWHMNLTPEEKQDFYARTHAWYHALSDEEKTQYAKDKKEIWENLSDDEKAIQTKHVLSSSAGKNKLVQRFEKAFNDSHLPQQFYFQSEVVLHNNGVVHSWDFGIYDKHTKQLMMVVDLDGSFYHGDSCDYDGIHSKEEYDEKRSLSVSDDVKICIIQDTNFTRCFEAMVKLLMINYDEYVNNMFKSFRLMPFPNPQYSDVELLKSYSSLVRMKCDDKYHNDISLNTRIGDRLIQHFHPSIYQANTKGNISPYEAWYNDDLLQQVIENRIIYQTYLNPNKILQGFNISKIAPKVSVFSAGRAKLLISKYLNDCNEIFDPFSGFSGRMLGAISLGKQYIGQDISDIHINESNRMIEFLTDYKDIVGKFNATVSCANVLSSYGSYECLFTCPPYEDKEQWLDVPVDTRTCDDWIDECLNRFDCKRYLFVVDYTTKYNDYVVDKIPNKSHFSNNTELVILIER